MTTRPFMVFDLETRYSAEDCRHCGQDAAAHFYGGIPQARCPDSVSAFEALGWHNTPALGLSIGCYWHNAYQRCVFFDEHTLEFVMQECVETQPLLVSFNGIGFDFALMRGLLRRRAETLPPEDAQRLTALCDQFKVLAAGSYDLLAEIWNASPESKRTKGLNGLDAIALANGLPGKTGTGADAPRLWAAGKIATVCNYVAFDVELTRRLFEQVLEGKPIRRHDGSSLLLPRPEGVTG